MHGLIFVHWHTAQIVHAHGMAWACSHFTAINHCSGQYQAAEGLARSSNGQVASSLGHGNGQYLTVEGREIVLTVTAGGPTERWLLFKSCMICMCHVCLTFSDGAEKNNRRYL